MVRNNIDEGELRGVREYCVKEKNAYNQVKAALEKVKGQADSITKGVQEVQADFNAAYSEGGPKKNEISGRISGVAGVVSKFISNLTAKINEVNQRINFYTVFISNCDRALAEGSKTKNINNMNIFDANRAINEEAEVRYNISGNTVTVVTV